MAEARSARAPRVWIGSAFALLAGAAIAWMDTRPNWDDTGVTAGAVFLAAAGASLVGAPPLLAAALVALPMILVEIHGGAGVLLAVPFALVGAFAGMFVRRIRL